MSCSCGLSLLTQLVGGIGQLVVLSIHIPKQRPFSHSVCFRHYLLFLPKFVDRLLSCGGVSSSVMTLDTQILLNQVDSSMMRDLPKTICVEMGNSDVDDDISIDLDEDTIGDDTFMSDGEEEQESNMSPRLQAAHLAKSSSRTFGTSSKCFPHYPYDSAPVTNDNTGVSSDACNSDPSMPNSIIISPLLCNSAFSVSRANKVTPDPSVCTGQTGAESLCREQELKQLYYDSLERLAHSMRYTDESRSTIEETRRCLLSSTSRGLSSAERAIGYRSSIMGYRSEMYEWVQHQRASMK